MEYDQQLNLPLVVSAVVLVATWLAVKLWNNRNLPPGPWGLPFFGYYPFLNEISEDFFKLSKIYGNLFSFRTLGGKLIIVLNGSKTIKEVFVNRADEFLGRPFENNTISWVSNGVGIAQEKRLAWSEQRKFIMQIIRNFGVGKLEMEERIYEEIRQMLAKLRNLESLKSVNMHFHVACASNNIISHVLFGEKKKSEDVMRKILKSATIFTGKLHIIVGYPFDLLLRLIPIMRKRGMVKNEIRKFTDDIVDTQIQTFDPTHVRGYVDAYLQNMDSLQKKGMLKSSTFTKERLRANVMNLFMEGTESVSFGIAGFLTKLSKHLDVQKKVQEEIDNIVGRERLPSWLDRQKLPYFDATIQELFRTTSPFLTSTHYSNFEETTISGYRIPRRSIIIANLYKIHFDPELYPEPELFDPTRFLTEEGRKVKTEGLHPYGIGKRACIGESLAQMEVFLITAAILQNYTLHAGDRGLRLRLEPRQ